LGSNNALKDLALKHGLHDYVVKNPCQQGEVQCTTLDSTVDAILGAMWTDSNSDIEKVKLVIEVLKIEKF